jgi:hypothetical protein
MGGLDNKCYRNQRKKRAVGTEKMEKYLLETMGF